MAAEFIRNLEGGSNSATRRKPVKTGDTVYDGDFVYDAGGVWSAASIGTGSKRLVGVVNGGDTEDLIYRKTGSATVGDGTRKVLVVIGEDNEYLMPVGGTGAGSLSSADEGSYFNLTGAPGSQVVDYATKSATAGQVYILKANPGIRNTTTGYALVKISQRAGEVA